MELMKKKQLRRISFTYRELSKLLELPKEEFTIGVWGNEIKFWKHDEANLKDWEISGSIEEIGKKVGLLNGEKIISDDYWVFTGYHLIIETNKENLKRIQLKLPKRIIFKLKSKSLIFKRWKKVSDLFANTRNKKC